MEIVRRGRWLYDNSVFEPVDIVTLNYDFWYALARASDQLEPDEVPRPLNGRGVLYYYRFRKAGDLSTPTWPDSSGFLEVEQAMLAAQESAPSSIEWE